MWRGAIRSCGAWTCAWVQVDVQLKLFAFPTSQPLYVATYWPSVAPERAKAVLERLRAAGYHLVTSHEAFPDSAHMHREQRALVEYFLGLAAHRFLGNSVSSFAALALVERRHLGRWAAYYNGGDIPMAQILPVVHKLPWVFTYNSWSGNYDYMLKAAVRCTTLQARHFGPGGGGGVLSGTGSVWGFCSGRTAGPWSGSWFTSTRSAALRSDSSVGTCFRCAGVWSLTRTQQAHNQQPRSDPRARMVKRKPHPARGICRGHWACHVLWQCAYPPSILCVHVLLHARPAR